MTNKVSVIVVVVAALLVAAPVHAQLGQRDDLNISPDPGEPYSPLPTPGTPPMPFSSDEMQLVGFTDRLFTGNEGVLNMSIACQSEFADSRMCTMEEITRSVYIAEALGHGYAWIQMPPDHTDALINNCNSWMSDSPLHKGVAIELGVCYGGFKEMPCNLELVVACCAKEGETVQR